MIARAAAVIAALVLSAGCGTDGRDLAEPAPGATAPPLPSSSTTPSSGGADAQIGPGPGAGSNAETEPAPAIVLSSPAFADGGAIPERHSCAGPDLSPSLAWTAVPPGTAELVVLVIDVTAGGDTDDAVLWAVAGIDPVVVGLGEDGVPEGAIEAVRWAGPCPPQDTVHEYLFALYALPARSGLTREASAAEVATAAAGTPAGLLLGVYPAPSP